LRSLGYKKKIISFEPTSDAFSKLKKASKKDLKWDVFNYSLGHFDGETEINISKNSVSSSILDNLPQLLESAPEAKYLKKETIKIKKLDTLFNELNIENQNIYLKIDTQGFEENILNGGLLNLSKIKIIQIEMALVQSYRGTLSFEEMTKKLNDLNFKIFSIESGYYDKKTGRLLEVDGIFINEILE
jgi:FkbM family methyltransferase